MKLVNISDLNGPPEEVARMIGEARGLSVMYDEYVNSEHDEARAAGIHASEVAGCKRRLVYSTMGYEQKGSISKFWRQRFKVGHAIHAMIQRDFKRMVKRSIMLPHARKLASANGWVLEFENEVEISPKLQPIAERYNFVSSCDGVFVFREHALGPVVLRVALEIKTESPDGYDKLNGPKEEHLTQAHIYMACLDIPLMWFMYFSKGSQNNTGSEAPWLVPFNPTIWAAVEARVLEAADLAQKNTLPPREESIGCEFCKYPWHCQPAYLGRARPVAARLEKIRTSKA